MLARIVITKMHRSSFDLNATGRCSNSLREAATNLAFDIEIEDGSSMIALAAALSNNNDSIAIIN